MPDKKAKPPTVPEIVVVRAQLTTLQKLERAGQVVNLLADLSVRDAEDVLRATLNVLPS